jgi:DNA-binding transcriptional regulator YhcF (GntR family)
MFIACHSANVQGMPRSAQKPPAAPPQPQQARPQQAQPRPQAQPQPQAPAAATAPPPSFAGLAVDRNADVPIGVQLAWALRTRIGEGDFAPGQRLPGMRDLAEAIGVNLNTIRAVYQRLEQEGLIESQQGSGTFVAPSGPQGSAAGTIAATAARTARETGVDPREVAAALYVAPENAVGDIEQTGEPSALEQRRRLREQIAAFESALGQIEAANPGVAPPASAMGLGAGPALLGTEELEHVRTMLVRLALVQATIDELAETDVEQTSDRRLARTASADFNSADTKAGTDDTATSAVQSKRTRRPRTSARALPST